MIFGIWRIKQALSKPHPDEVVKRFGDSARTPLLALLRQEKSDLHLPAVTALTTMPNDDVIKLFVQLLDTNDAALYSALESALVDFSSISVLPLSDAFENTEDSSRRVKILRILNDINCIEGVSPLINALNDADAFVRLEAISALTRSKQLICESPMFGRLIDVLTNGKSPDARASAAKVVATIRCPESSEPLSIAVADHDSIVRLAAVRALITIGDTNIGNTFINSLDDTDWEVREAALDGIRKLGNIKEAIPKFIGLLSPQHDTIVNNMAQEFLTEVCQEHIAEFRSALEDSDTPSHARANLLKILDKSGDYGPETIHALSSGISDVDEGVRTVAIESLEQFGNKYVHLFIAALSNDSYDVQLSAIEAIERIGTIKNIQPLIELLDSGWESLQKASLRVLTKVGHDHIDALVTLAKSPATSGWIRAELFRFLAQLSPSAYIDLILPYKDDNEDSVRLAVLDISAMVDNDHDETIITFLTDPSPLIRKTAIVALHKRNAIVAIKPTINMLGDKDSDVQNTASNLLSTIGKADLNLLRSAAKNMDISSRIRARLIEILSKIDDDQALPIFELSLSDDNSIVRRAAVTAIGISKHSDLELLQQMKQDTNSKVRNAVDLAIKNKTTGQILSNAKDGDFGCAMENIAKHSIDLKRSERSSLIKLFTHYKFLSMAHDALKHTQKDVREIAIEITTEIALGCMNKFYQLQDPEYMKLIDERVEDLNLPTLAISDVRDKVWHAACSTIAAKAAFPVLFMIADRDKDVRTLAAFRFVQIRESYSGLKEALELFAVAATKRNKHLFVNALHDDEYEIETLAFWVLETANMEAPYVHILDNK